MVVLKEAKSIELRNAAVFDGTSGTLRGACTVRIADGKIVSISSAADSRPGDAAQVIDLQGATLMPGLIDAHFHCFSPTLKLPELDQSPSSYLASYASRLLEDTLQRGFTTVRDAGGADVGLVRALDEGLIEGPRLLIAGKALSQTGGHGDQRAIGAPEPCGCGYSGQLSQVVDGADHMRRVVRNHLHHGAHHIKLFVSGGVLSPSDPLWMDQFTDEEIRVAVEEARRRRTYVMAHAHTAAAVNRCVKNGVRTVEHATLIDREAADAVAAAGAFVVPTLSIIERIRSFPLPQASLDKLAELADGARRAVEICRAAGVQLGLGTDYFGQMHGGEAQELVQRATVQPAVEVLRSATSVNGAIVDPNALLGKIVPGAPADVLVVRGNPLSDISVLADSSNLLLIARGGRIVKNAFAAAPAAA